MGLLSLSRAVTRDPSRSAVREPIMAPDASFSSPYIVEMVPHPCGPVGTPCQRTVVTIIVKCASAQFQEYAEMAFPAHRNQCP